jgi:hypothetical protein
MTTKIKYQINIIEKMKVRGSHININEKTNIK